MYKIYINEIPLLLKITEDIKQEDAQHHGVLVARYTGKVKHLLNFIDMCEKGVDLKCIIIHHHDLSILKLDFKSLFTINEAAGGLVYNENKELLVIFRRGFWDLPKGKKEKAETKKEAAVREVIEETGLKAVELGEKIGVTNHTFRNKAGERILKKSHWYMMTAKKQRLIPQATEDIEKALWMDKDKFLKTCKPIYSNIKDILSQVEHM